MFRNLTKRFFNSFDFRNRIEICKRFRDGCIFRTSHGTVNSMEHYIDTRGSGFSLKTASVIAVLFGSVHLSLMSSSKYSHDQTTEIEYITKRNTKTASQIPKTISCTNAPPIERKVDEDAIEQSLLSLIKSATVKVQNCATDHYPDSQLPPDLAIDSDAIDAAAHFDDVIKRADARREIKKIIDAVDTVRHETDNPNHPLLVVAEATARFLANQMVCIENRKLELK